MAKILNFDTLINGISLSQNESQTDNIDLVFPSSSGTLALLSDIPSYSGFVTTSELTTILEGYVTSSDLTTTLEDYVLSSDLATTLEDYITSSDLTTALEDYVTDTALTTTLSDYVQTSDIAGVLGLEDEFAINLVKYPYYTSSGTENNSIKYTYGEDGVITVKGTASSLSNFVIVAVGDKVEISPSTEYTFSGISGGSDSTYFIRLTTYDSNSSNIENVDFYDTTTFTTAANAKYIRLTIYVRGAIAVNKTISPMLEKGDTAHPYKRYWGEGETPSEVLTNNYDILRGCQKQIGSSAVSTATYTVPAATSTNVCTLPLSKGINIIRVGVSVPNSITNTDFTMTFSTTANSDSVATGTSEHQYIGNAIGSKRTVLDFVYTGVSNSDTTLYANLIHNNAGSITVYTYARIINIPTE